MCDEISDDEHWEQVKASMMTPDELERRHIEGIALVRKYFGRGVPKNGEYRLYFGHPDMDRLANFLDG